MISRTLRQGLAAGLLAGLLAGVVGLVIAQPAFTAAIAYEDAAHHDDDDGHAQGRDDGHEHGFARPVQQAGLVAGSGLAGLAVGAIFGLAAAWAIGRLEGDSWTRACKLGAVALGAVVVLPALVLPASPPGVEAASSVGQRTLLYVATVAVGLGLALALRAGHRRLAETGLTRPARQTILGTGLLVAAGAWVALTPSTAASGDFPADVLWSFRLAGLATQSLLVGGTAVVFGLLASRAERDERQPATTSARGATT